MATAPARGRALPAAADAAAETTRALYERYSRQIFAYCLVQLRNREEAEDAVQSTFLNAFRGLERGVLPELESAWLYKIAQHVCLTRQRSWSRRRLVESPQELETATRLLGAPAHDGDEIAGLTEALRELPEQQRRAILLREWQGLTYKEIADELQVSQAAVETLIFRARRGLARSLEKLRAMTDLGSLAAALKSLLIGGGTKVAAALVTVATTSVVAATPAARHGVVHFVDAVAGTAPPARTEVRPRPKPSPPPKPVAVAVAPTVSPVKRHASSRPVAPKPVAVRATTKAPVDHATPPPAVVHHEPPPKQTVDPTPAPAAATTPATTTTAAPAPPPPAVDTPATPAGVTKAPVPVPAPVAPSISGFTPASGAPGTVVQVIGKSFTGATAVRFNGTSADFTVTSDGQVTTRVPAAATSGPIAIVTPTGTVTSDASFTVTTTTTTPTATTPATTTTGTPPPVAPSVSGVSPSSGPPGTIVQIAGAHLTGTNAVRFGDATADFTVVSDAQITAKVPTSAASGPITVVTSQGTASAGSFTVTAAAPTIDGFTPRIGPVGSSVILVGHNFAGATGVSLNGTAAAFKVDSDTQLTFDVPPGATSGPVSVTTPNGTVTSSTTFTVGTPPPEISGFSPASGAVGSSVGIGGTRFTGATSVKFNGVAASFSVSSDGLITAVVPAGATSGTVTVTTPAGTATSSTSFTVTH